MLWLIETRVVFECGAGLAGEIETPTINRNKSCIWIARQRKRI